MSRNIDDVAEAHWDKKWNDQCDAEDLGAYLEEQGITLEQHQKNVADSKAEAAIDAMLDAQYYGD